MCNMSAVQKIEANDKRANERWLRMMREMPVSVQFRIRRQKAGVKIVDAVQNDRSRNQYKIIQQRCMYHLAGGMAR